MKSIFAFILICIAFIGQGFGQECPNLISPVNNQTNVAVDATIVWEQIEGVTGYIVSLGTTPGGTEIINNQANGSSNSIKPPVGLPENTRVYVTITLFFFNRPNIECPTQSFVTEDVTMAPDCTTLRNPTNGATNVNVATNISWDYASRATSYRISIGRTPGGTEFANNIDVGNTLSYNPPSDFPPDTDVYVTITPYNENGSASGCSEEFFSIGALATLPGCTRLITPADGSINVPLSPLLQWEAVPGATGYIVSIGKTPTENDIIDEGVFRNTSTFVFNFESNNVYFVRIVPFNDAGRAIDCGQETFSTMLGCGPFYDELTGELITINPDLEFPEVIGICSGVRNVITADNDADGYRWYKVDQFGEVLISSGAEIEITTAGDYILEIYNYTDDEQIECSSFAEFSVVESEPPEIVRVNINEQSTGLDIEVEVEGTGDYEYALDSPDGPYQDSNTFFNAPLETTSVFVRDKNGCGITEYQFQFVNNSRGFPKFFTPNGDGYNDRWQYKPEVSDNFTLRFIQIFDRYGKLLKTQFPSEPGWNGTFAGQALPTADYWYVAETSDGNVITGHFALRR